MPKCRRCGTPFVRRTPSQMRCDQCTREVAVLVADKPLPTDAPPWRRRDLKRDETGYWR